MKKFLIVLGIIVITIIGLFVISKNKPPLLKTTQLQKGISLSPKSYNQKDFLAFWEKAKEAGSVVTWAGKTSDLKNERGAPYTVSALSKQYGLTPAIFTFPPDKDTIVNFVKKEKPPYLAIGVEVNRLNSSDFQNLVKVFPEIYKAVKNVSPETKVFTVFQLENLKGLNGGLFGGTNNSDKNHWDDINLFPDADLVGFTTYPFLIYKNPSDIPSDYYSEIKTHTQKPVAFIEIGWPSKTIASGWEESEAKQAQFVSRFFELTKGLDVKLAIWTYLYDQDIQTPFTSIGLFDKQGNAKQAWEAWKSN